MCWIVGNLKEFLLVACCLICCISVCFSVWTSSFCCTSIIYNNATAKYSIQTVVQLAAKHQRKCKPSLLFLSASIWILGKWTQNKYAFILKFWFFLCGKPGVILHFPVWVLNISQQLFQSFKEVLLHLAKRTPFVNHQVILNKYYLI